MNFTITTDDVKAMLDQAEENLKREIVENDNPLSQSMDKLHNISIHQMFLEVFGMILHYEVYGKEEQHNDRVAG